MEKPPQTDKSKLQALLTASLNWTNADTSLQADPLAAIIKSDLTLPNNANSLFLIYDLSRMATE